MHGAVVLCLDNRLLERLAGRAADVERAHRQLRSGLADGLRSDDANGFSELHKITSGQIAAVTHRAHAAAALARKHRTDFKLFDTDALQLGSDLLVDVLVCL